MFIEKTVCRHIKKALLIQKGFENSCLSGSLKGFGPLVLSLSKFLVQVKKRCHILAYPLQLCHLICGALLFLYLLVNEPLQAAECGKIALAHCHMDKVMNHLSHLLLVREGIVKHIKRTFPLLADLLYRTKPHARAAVVHIILKDSGMILLLKPLYKEPIRYDCPQKCRSFW